MKTKHTARSGSFSLRLLLCSAAICSIITGTLLAFFHSEAPAKASQRMLTFAERVAYQRAIEDVYWHHRIWPKERPDRKPSLDAVMSQAQLERKVEHYLHDSQVLEDYWQLPITTEQLQAEMDRMAKHTRQPEVLRELFEALGNDPVIIAECVARPALVERLMAKFYGRDQGVLGSDWARAQHRVRNVMLATSGNYTLPRISDGPSGCIDNWAATSTINAPTGRYEHTAVWTGSEMIVWGGEFPPLNTGGRYNPSTDSWTATSTTNAPSARYDHTAVWTGSEMIVWGAGSGNTGGRYNPITDSWTATSTVNAPSGRAWNTAVWTGSEMIVWGGFDGSELNTGGRYDPKTDSWTATSTANAPIGRFYHTAVWTGSEMIVWGGRANNSPLGTGGRYNLNTDTWTATTTSNPPIARDSHRAAWTGNEMVVWGGAGHNNFFRSGGRYCAQSGPTPTPTATSTPTAIPSATPTPTLTATPTTTPRSSPAPRIHPTPVPRP